MNYEQRESDLEIKEKAYRTSTIFIALIITSLKQLASSQTLYSEF